jgi:glyoxylate/hydroxypyruvate reductase A
MVRLDDAGMSVQMAEYVCHAVIRHFREFDGYEADVAGPLVVPQAAGRADFAVGVMGLGVLGERVAQAVRSFEFPVNGWSRSPKALDGVRTFSGREGLPDFLAASRVLVCLLPLTPDTQRHPQPRHAVAPACPAAMSSTWRAAPIWWTTTCWPCWTAGHLAGATLDVFRTEPLPAEHAFWRHPRITVTPHTSARTLRDESIAQIAGKIRALERASRTVWLTPCRLLWSTPRKDTDTMNIAPPASNWSTSARATACRTKSSRYPPPSRSSWCTACRTPA